MKKLLSITILCFFVMWWQFLPDDQNFVISNNDTTTIAAVPLMKVEVDGHFKDQPLSSSAGNWLNKNLRALFDYFTAMYEQSEQLMWSEFKQYCTPLTYCSDMTELFERYLQYKISLAGVDEDPLNTPEQFAKRLDDIENLRHKIFTVLEKQVLFSDEENWDRQAITRMQINQDPYLSDEQKMILLEEHIDSLPIESKEAIMPTLNLRKVSQIREQSGEIGENNYNLFAAQFGSEVAQRLVDTEKSQQQWQTKVQLFLAQKKVLANEFSTESELYQHALLDLENELFDSNESRRLKVYLSNPSLLELR